MADPRGLLADEHAQITEPMLGDRRLVVPRVRTVNAQGDLLPSWEHYPSPSTIDALHVVEAEHRKHAVFELAISDLWAASGMYGQVRLICAPFCGHRRRCLRGCVLG